MYTTLAKVQYTTHSAVVSQDRHGRILCFKHDDRRCSFDLFDSSDLDTVADFILEPMPSGGYAFEEGED